MLPVPELRAESGGLVVALRFRAEAAADVAGHGADELISGLREALAQFSLCPGFASGEVCQSIDDPHALMLMLRWQEVGAYRRALSRYYIKVAVVPLLSLAQDEPSAFEVATAADGHGIRDFGSLIAADAQQVRLGEAAAGVVPPLR